MKSDQFLCLNLYVTRVRYYGSSKKDLLQEMNILSSRKSYLLWQWWSKGEMERPNAAPETEVGKVV